MIRLWSKSKGFTLLEIILVVLILAVIAGLAVPNFRHTFNSFQVQRAADDLTYVMRYAQSRSITKGVPVRLEFNSDYSQYWLTQRSEESTEFKRFSGRLGVKYAVPPKVKVHAENTMLYFHPDGNIDKQRIAVCIKDECYTVSTKEQRGYVRRYKGNLSQDANPGQ